MAGRARSRRGEGHVEMDRLVAAAGDHADALAAMIAPQGAVEVLDAGDLDLAELDDHVAAAEAGPLGRTVFGHAGQGVAGGVGSKVRNAAEVTAAVVGRQRRQGHVRGPLVAVRQGDRHVLDELLDALHPGEVQLVERVGRP